MFKRSIHTKTRNVLKSSEKRKLRVDILSRYPLLSESLLNNILPAKEEIEVVKSLGHANKPVKIYFCNNEPLFFEVDGALFPSGLYVEIRSSLCLTSNI